MKIAFRPKLLDCLPGYNRTQFGKDLASGITVGVLALPLAMAFAIASGVSPTAGIWTAIVAGFLTAALGGSRVQIGGPTGAFIPIIYGIVAMHGFVNLLGATMLAGFFLLAMGLARMGQLIRFIPVTVVIGFTNGIAVVIFLAQLKDFFGLQIDNLPAEFFHRIKTLAAYAHTVDLPTLGLASACFVFLLSYNKLAQKIAILRRAPGPLAVLVVGTLVSFLFELPVETIGSRFNGIPQEMPDFGLPALSIHDLGKLISPAITIALLGAIESLLSARVADSQIDDRQDRYRPRHHRQPEGQGCHLHLCRHRTEGELRRPAQKDAGNARRDGLYDHRQRHGERSRAVTVHCALRGLRHGRILYE